MKSHKLLAVTGYLILCCILGGCVGLPIEEASTRLKAGNNCCRDPSEMTFKPLTAAMREKFELSSGSPMFNFPEGPSFFAAYSIPKGVQRLTIQALNTEYLPRATYVDPAVLVLDSQKRIINRFRAMELRRSQQRYMLAFLEYYYGATIPLPDSAAFIVVYADPTSNRTQLVISETGRPWPVRPVAIGTVAVILD